jgi:hypothetical protein
VARDVDPDLPHDLNGFGAHRARLGSYAEDSVSRPTVVAEQPLCHLAAC